MDAQSPRPQQRRGRPSGRVAGKKYPETRQGFVIYLPRPVHAQLRAIAEQRGVTMSELASTAVAQYLGVLADQPPAVAQAPLPQPVPPPRPGPAPPPPPVRPTMVVSAEAPIEIED